MSKTATQTQNRKPEGHGKKTEIGGLITPIMSYANVSHSSSSYNRYYKTASDIFFNCYLAVPQPTLGYSQAGSLTNPM